MKKILKMLSILMVVGLMLIPTEFAFATNVNRELTDREKAAFIVRDEWTTWVKAFTASLSELDKNATSRIYDNMDYYDMQYRFTEKYKKVPEYLDEDGKPTQKLKDLIKRKRKELNGAKIVVRDDLMFTSLENGSTVGFTLNGLDASTIDIGWSKDGITWTKWTGNALPLNSGESIYIWNKSSTLSTGASSYLKFNMTGRINATGNVDSLVNYTGIKSYCYAHLFEDCTAMVQAPEVPSTTIAEGCYYNMFRNCSGIPNAPDLLATTLEPYCYYGAFDGCSALYKTNKLPAKVLKESCYEGMFRNCTGLISSPHLGSLTLANNCYKNMFNGCSNLNHIETSYTGAFTETHFKDWVAGVKSSGEFYYEGTDVDNFGPSAIPLNAVQKWDVIQALTELKFSASEASSIKWLVEGTLDGQPSMEYSQDRIDWTSWDEDTAIDLALGESVYIRNKNNFLSKDSSNYVHFDLTGSLLASGQANSLLNGIDYVPRYAFYKLFVNCTSLTSSPVLPATSVANNCYDSMFYGCTNLLNAPSNLPATTLNKESYSNMFNGCTSLVRTPKIKATTYAERSCYAMFSGCTAIDTMPDILATQMGKESCANMFDGCTSLVYTSKLPATTMTEKCYSEMFKGCTSLVASPLLMSTTLAEHCYENMFNGCTSLTTPSPELPATTLAPYCYANMFYNCTSLVSIPQYLPAKTLTEHCYENMFYGCTALKVAPILPATTLANACYKNMFQGCTSMSYMKLGYLGNFDNQYFENWVDGVAEEGQFHYRGTDLTNYGVSSIPKESANKWELISEDTPLKLYAREPSTVQYKKYASLGTYDLDVNIQYSRDNVTWTQWTADTPIDIAKGEAIYVRNIGTRLSYSDYKYIYFVMTGKIAASGNIASMLKEGKVNHFQNVISYLFRNCASLITPPDISKVVITSTIPDSVFQGLFSRCANLIAAPELPLLTLNNSKIYYEMFDQCTSLTYPPYLPATTLSHMCYLGMFSYCTNLKYAPILRASNLAGSCYWSMFESSGITTAPDISATTLQSYCYYGMFKYCNQLVVAPEILPATKFEAHCYYQMFYGCTKLKTAPRICATNVAADYAMQYMFYNCSNLNYIQLDYQGNFTIDGIDAGKQPFGSWVYNVSSSGYFIYSGTDTTRGTSAIPNGWTVLSIDD